MYPMVRCVSWLSIFNCHLRFSLTFIYLLYNLTQTTSNVYWLVPLRIVLVNTLVETIIILGPSNKLLKRVSSNKLNKEDVQETVRVVNELMDDFMKKLKEISPSFGWNKFNSGSYYDKTKVTSFHKMQWVRGMGITNYIYIFVQNVWR